MLVDESPYETWEDWSASIRDLYFLNPDGTLFDSYNITMSESSDEDVSNTILTTISSMLSN
jgi:hypothetical protein